MIIYEPRNNLEVNTPKGKATIWLITEYGAETPKLFTCIIKNTGEIWEYTNQDITATNNITFQRNLDHLQPNPPTTKPSKLPPPPPPHISPTAPQ